MKMQSGKCQTVNGSETSRSGANIYAGFCRACSYYGRNIAIDDGKARYEYLDLMRIASRLGQTIIEAAPARGPVGLLLRPTVRFPAALLACFATERDVIILDADSPSEHIAEITREGGISALFMDEEGRDLPRLHTRSGNAWQPTERKVRTEEYSQIQPALWSEGSLVILYTSGSTGKPKGIVNSQVSILERCWQHIGACGADEKDVFMPLSPPSTIAGLREALSALLCGATLRIVDQKQAGLRETARIMREAQATICYAVPTLLRALIKTEADHSYLASLHVLRVGGERVLWSDVEMLRAALPSTCAINVAYSSTETIGANWFLPPDMQPDDLPVPVGYIVPHVELRVVDPNRNPVPTGAIGELMISSRYVALGYWEDGHCVLGEMQVDPADPAQRIFHTGDLASMDASGLLRVFGRNDRQVKVRGQRVEPGELEAALRISSKVIDAVVCLRRTDDDAALVAFVTADGPNILALEADLRSLVRQRLRQALHPAAIYVLEVFPSLQSGKVDRAALLEFDRQQCQSVGSAASAVPTAAGSTMTLVCRLWDEILGASSTLGKTWDEAGGDSLKFLRLMFEIEQALGRSVLPGPFMVDMMPRDIALALDQQPLATKVVATVAGRVFLFPGVGGDEPRLEALRQTLHGQLLIATVRYPEWVALSSPRYSFFDMVLGLATQISEIAPEGSLSLVGYSYGGIVAFAVARLLRAEGRNIACLGLIDTKISAPTTGMVRLRRIPAWLFRSDRHNNLCRLIANQFQRPALRLLSLRILVRRPKPRWVSSRTRFTLNYWVCCLRRVKLATAWLDAESGASIEIPARLFRSEQWGEDESNDLGWSRLLPNMEVVHVTGDHLTMLDPPHLLSLSEALLNYCRIERAALAP
jgi:acyl-coenzyme A synthetase/AMP-(fatty) acid ligase/thioesterase domain-containing protein